MLTPRLRRVVAGALIAGGVLLVALGAVMGWRVHGLAARGVETRARVTSVRERGDSDTGIVATYEFEVGGVRYQHRGLFGEVPADITEAQRARAREGLPVRYLPENPAVNEPLSGSTPSETRQLFAVGIGLLMTLIGGFRWWMAGAAPNAS